MTLSQTLEQIYQRLFEYYGPQHWWPADDSFEVVVGAILTQSAAWTNVERAVNNLKKENALNPVALRQIAVSELADLIRPSGYFNVKARKLKAFVERLGDRYADSLESMFALNMLDLRTELLSIYGIGQETADSIILYAARKPVFVIDAYTHRIMERLGFHPNKGNYSSLQSLFMENLPHDEKLFNEYHALFVRHGKVTCKKTPLCGMCCLSDICGSSI
ncbi:MAG: endonuclease III domain-containing protein [Chloroflexota bacterium]